jgi:hypothetical protein
MLLAITAAWHAPDVIMVIFSAGARAVHRQGPACRKLDGGPDLPAVHHAHLPHTRSAATHQLLNCFISWLCISWLCMLITAEYRPTMGHICDTETLSNQSVNYTFLQQERNPGREPHSVRLPAATTSAPCPLRQPVPQQPASQATQPRSPAPFVWQLYQPPGTASCSTIFFSASHAFSLATLAPLLLLLLLLHGFQKPRAV